jgi:hypothetical protein
MNRSVSHRRMWMGVAAFAVVLAASGCGGKQQAAQLTATTSAPTVTEPPSTTVAPTTTVPTTTVPTTTKPRATTTRRPATTRPAPALTVTITGLPATGQGNAALATVRTLPGARCDIVVEYKSGPSTAHGLYPKTASGFGEVSWSWMVGTRTTPGSWPVTVTCSRSNVTRSATRYLTVLDTGGPG